MSLDSHACHYSVTIPVCVYCYDKVIMGIMIYCVAGDAMVALQVEKGRFSVAEMPESKMAPSVPDIVKVGVKDTLGVMRQSFERVGYGKGSGDLRIILPDSEEVRFRSVEMLILVEVRAVVLYLEGLI
jgi:hypothetical protein